jgi:thioredoxin 1
MLRRHFIFAVFFFPLLGAEVAHAATEARFDQTSFLAAQKAGSPILVHIAASWCPICAVQRPILQKLSADPGFEKLVIFTVDFDAQKEVVKAMGAQKQSTFIAFHGATERGRSVGDTSVQSIESMVAKTAN